MQLTYFTDYALRTLIYLGANPDRLCTIGEVAKAYGISANHLMKVVNRLSTHGYIESIRGKGGGIRLARAPRLINIGAVVRDLEERFDIVECFNEAHQTCPLLPACTLKSVLKDARRNFMGTLERYTLQDIQANQPGGAFLHSKSGRIPIRRADKL